MRTGSDHTLTDAVLLDTDVFSFLMKRDHELGDAYLPHVKGKRIGVSFVTVGELYSGAYKRNWSAKSIAELEARLRAAVIIPYDIEVCKSYARLVALKTAEGSDRTIRDNDRWIAACALRHELPLVSHNRKHFEDIPDLTLISETQRPPEPKDSTLPLGG